MKDLIDAINTRVKEPYWGFFLLSFLAFNWKGLFLLCFAVGTAQERIGFFESQTTLWSLLVCPIGTAFIILLSKPWLKVLFGKISRIAYEQLNSQDLKREYEYRKEKNLLDKQLLVSENTTTNLYESKEAELIDRAKRDLEIEKIEDENVKNNLKNEVEKLRQERDQTSKKLFGNANLIQISPEEKEILQAASTDKSGQIIRRTFIGGRFIQAGNLHLGAENNMEFLKYDEALKSLRVKGLIQDVGQKGEIFEISYKGWEFISKFGLDK